MQPPVLNSRHLQCLLALGSVVPLSVAVLSQYGFGQFPCDMCVLQRYPYAAVAVLLSLSFWFKSTIMLRVLLGAALLAWATNAGIAIYHVGIEQHWWGAESGCVAKADGGDVLAAILSSPLVSCADVGASFAGMSMATWNALAASVLTLYAVILLITNRK